MDLNLQDFQWDCCVLGNGVSALWLSHWLWTSKKSVLWITGEEPYSPERAMLQHSWLWGISPEHASVLTGQLQGFEFDGETPPFEAIYYDARSSKRFRKFSESKPEWGSHEKEYFTALVEQSSKNYLDLWNWHAKLHAFHDSGQVHGPTTVELFSEPRFVRVQGWPVVELKTTEGKVSAAALAGLRKDETTEIRAGQFYLADYDESLAGMIKTHEDSDRLAGAMKGKSYRAGFGLRLWHKELATAINQTAVIPLIVSPEKDAGSHVAGRFVQKAGGLESFWVGFLTDEELEDNNEILKKIKQTKRAIDRAIPGFIDSITREAVTFEPRMRAQSLVKSRKSLALGATIVSDHFGSEAAAEAVRKIFLGIVDEPVADEKKKTERSKSQKRAPAPEASP